MRILFHISSSLPYDFSCGPCSTLKFLQSFHASHIGSQASDDLASCWFPRGILASIIILKIMYVISYWVSCFWNMPRLVGCSYCTVLYCSVFVSQGIDSTLKPSRHVDSCPKNIASYYKCFHCWINLHDMRYCDCVTTDATDVLNSIQSVVECQQFKNETKR